MGGSVDELQNRMNMLEKKMKRMERSAKDGKPKKPKKKSAYNMFVKNYLDKCKKDPTNTKDHPTRFKDAAKAWGLEKKT